MISGSGRSMAGFAVEVITDDIMEYISSEHFFVAIAIEQRDVCNILSLGKGL